MTDGATLVAGGDVCVTGGCSPASVGVLVFFFDERRYTRKRAAHTIITPPAAPIAIPAMVPVDMEFEDADDEPDDPDEPPVGLNTIVTVCAEPSLPVVVTMAVLRGRGLAVVATVVGVYCPLLTLEQKTSPSAQTAKSY